MSEKKELNIKDLEKVTGGVGDSDLSKGKTSHKGNEGCHSELLFYAESTELYASPGSCLV